jgi:hypothetical protein
MISTNAYEEITAIEMKISAKNPVICWQPSSALVSYLK